MTDTHLKIHCNACGHETKHVLLHSRKTEDEEIVEGCGPVNWQDTYEMLECCGCESIVLRHSNYFAPTGETTVKHYPPLVSRPAPKWKYKLPISIGSLLDEIYNALYSDGRRLAIMGARTIVDIVMRDKIGQDKGSFGSNLKALEEQGVIGRKNREFLGAALDAGSAAAHRGYIPEPEDVEHVMDIVENLLEAAYILDKAAESLKRTTPQKKQIS
jgi:hypothetical protein